MKARDLKALEYNKIKEKLADKCVTYLGKELALELLPETNIVKVKKYQSETTEAVSLTLRKGMPPIFALPNLEESLKKINVSCFMLLF